MDNDLTRVKQNTLRYWFQDGLSDIVIGALFIVLGVINILQDLLEPGSIFSGLSGLAILIVVAVGIPISRKIIRTVKERFTYPRTGYVAYHGPSPLQRILSVVLGISIAVIVSVLVLVSPRTSILWTPFILGLALAGFLILIAHRTALMRYQGMAILVAITGLGLSFSGFSVTISTGIVFLALGLMLILSGIIALNRYIRSTGSNLESTNDF